jgi:hypothetical protein
MTGLVPVIHVVQHMDRKVFAGNSPGSRRHPEAIGKCVARDDVDDRDNPGHDEGGAFISQRRLSLDCFALLAMTDNAILLFPDRPLPDLKGVDWARQWAASGRSAKLFSIVGVCACRRMIMSSSDVARDVRRAVCDRVQLGAGGLVLGGIAAGLNR